MDCTASFEPDFEMQLDRGAAVCRLGCSDALRGADSGRNAERIAEQPLVLVGRVYECMTSTESGA